MEIAGDLLASCICAGLKLALDQIVELEVKMKQGDQSIAIDIKNLFDNVKLYPKKDRKIIYGYVKKFMDMNASSASLDSNGSASRYEKRRQSEEKCNRCEKLEYQIRQIENLLVKLKDAGTANMDSQRGQATDNANKPIAE